MNTDTKQENKRRHVDTIKLEHDSDEDSEIAAAEILFQKMTGKIII